MKNAVIYARYSSEKQNEMSIEGQLAECHRYAAENDLLVYQLDRFARSMNDSGYYRKILAGNGVRVVSAKENIATDSSGVMTEGMLITMGQWFSAQPSEKDRRRSNPHLLTAEHQSGNITIG